MMKTEAEAIIAAYQSLVDRALEVTDHAPHLASVSPDDNPRLDLDGDNVVLQWKDYESDYYGGGYLRDHAIRFPISLLLMPAKEFAVFYKRLDAEERERQERLARAQAAVERDRQEARDRAEFARLKAKYYTAK